MGKIGLIIVGVLTVALVAACGSGTSSSDKTSTAVAGGVGGAQTAPAASPTTAAAPTTAASPTTAAATGTSTASTGGTSTSGTPAAGGGAVSLSINTPDDIHFDKSTLNATAGAQVTLTYTNNSDIPHNFHLFDSTDASGKTLATTDVKAGPNDVETVTFSAPTTPGRYYYQCDVHPTQMNGFLVVQ